MFNPIAWLLKGGVTTVADGVARGVEVFRPNAEAASARSHEYDLEVLRKYAAEFTQPVGRWDSFVNGLNRLPRPLFALFAAWLLVLPALNPVEALDVAKAYGLMPDGYWYLVLGVLAFYFGGRFQVEHGSFQIKKGALDTARQLMAEKAKVPVVAVVGDPLAPPLEDNPVTELQLKYQK